MKVKQNKSKKNGVYAYFNVTTDDRYILNEYISNKGISCYFSTREQAEVWLNRIKLFTFEIQKTLFCDSSFRKGKGFCCIQLVDCTTNVKTFPISKIFTIKSSKITLNGIYSNNFGELFAFMLSLLYVLLTRGTNNIKFIASDSMICVLFWSVGIYNISDTRYAKLIKLTQALRDFCEQTMDITISLVSGDNNLADLGYHS